MTPDPILRMTGIRKAFVGVKALDEVDLRLSAGEVHAVMGENGAGKSTLIKVLTGVHEIDAGEIVLKGRPVRFSNPMEAQKGGVSTVYPEVNLCTNVSVAENIFLGREPRRHGRIQWRAMRRQAAEALARVQLEQGDRRRLLAHAAGLDLHLRRLRRHPCSAAGPRSGCCSSPSAATPRPAACPASARAT
jgi:ABC-type sugar transport system ATPase subunit